MKVIVEASELAKAMLHVERAADRTFYTDAIPEALRGINLGDWGLMAPVARLGVAA